MSAHSTNLASEFHVLSVLHRLGANAVMTMANRKAVDIIVASDAGNASTIDVKGSIGTTGWYVGNVAEKQHHFVVFVTYLNKILDPTVAPEIYVVPSTDMKELIQTSSGGTKLVKLPALRKHIPPYRDNWQALL